MLVEAPRPGTRQVVSHHVHGVLRTRRGVARYGPGDFLKLLRRAVDDVGLTAVGEVGVALEPRGSSAVLVLTESHVAVHHWPELDRVTVDVHVCDFEGDNLARARGLATRLEQLIGPAGSEVRWHCRTVSG
jgi:S-adenosylmethionine decarboxylase